MQNNSGDQQFQIAATLTGGEPDGIELHPQSMGQIMRPITGLGVEFSQEPGGKYFVRLERGGYSHVR